MFLERDGTLSTFASFTIDPDLPLPIDTAFVSHVLNDRGDLAFRANGAGDAVFLAHDAPDTLELIGEASDILGPALNQAGDVAFTSDPTTPASTSRTTC